MSRLFYIVCIVCLITSLVLLKVAFPCEGQYAEEFAMDQAEWQD